MADRLARLCRGSGGQLDRDDLAGYRVIRRRPLVCEYRGHRVVTNPPPSCGGLLNAFALALLGEVAPDELACGPPARTHGRAHVCTTVTNTHHVCRRLID